MQKVQKGALLVALLISLAPSVLACEGGNVREAAFLEDRDEHVLCVIADGASVDGASVDGASVDGASVDGASVDGASVDGASVDGASVDGASVDDASADAIYDRLAEWQLNEGSSLNVKVERLNADDEDVRWRDYGMPGAPPTVPVTALVGRFAAQRRAFIIDHWEPAPTDEELAVLLESPVRVAMKDRMVDVWATLLFVPGTPGADGVMTEEEALAVFDPVAERWAEEQSPGITVVRLDRTDPEERTILTFTGIPETGPDWLGVVFGKGKLMAPPLEGDDIAKKNVNRLLESLATPCTCLAEVTVQGVDIPMTWGNDMQARLSSLADATGYVELTVGEATVPGPGGVEVTPKVKERLDGKLAELEAEVPGQRVQVWASALLPLVTIATLGFGVVLIAVARRKKGTP